ncbi:A disintegrin and metalloproteinase with thrombospondin motifs like [Tachypleus tridentatus]|uniref:A disintegrin and metalloproteinase with thrombospondin motifs like n=1 Tax=Tachypleus tridentatus TaxID=6853 RepID=UPI003FD1394E
MTTQLFLFMLVFISFGRSIPINGRATVLKTEVIHLSTGLIFRNFPRATLVEIYAFGRNFTLNLRKSNIIHENFKITEIFDSEKEPYVEQEVKVDLDDLKNSIYVDSSVSCVVYYKRNGNYIFMEGLLAENVIIVPLTPEFHAYGQLSLPLSSGDSNIDYNQGIPHAVILSVPKKNIIDAYVIPEVTETDDLQANFTSNVSYNVDESENYEFHELQPGAVESSEPNGIPEVLHPEVLVIMDYAHWKGLENVSVTAMTRYITVFWNVVNLRYSELIKPQVKLYLSGLIINKSSRLQPYIEDHRIKHGLVDGKNVLESINKYAAKWSSREYDLGILLTGEDLSKNDGSQDSWKLAGISFIGGACRQKLRIGVAEDEPGTYSGVKVAAHEMGHLFGVVHDGEETLNFNGSPGASSCPASDGYLMSPVIGGRNDYKWSTCSIKQLRHFFSLGRAKCLRVDTLRNDTLPSAPGQIITPTDMCHELYPQNRKNEVQAIISEKICLRLICQVGNVTNTYYTLRAYDGAACGNGKWCLNGECIQY